MSHGSGQWAIYLEKSYSLCDTFFLNLPHRGWVDFKWNSPLCDGAIAEYSSQESTAARLDSSLVYRPLGFRVKCNRSFVMKLVSVNCIPQLP